MSLSVKGSIGPLSSPAASVCGICHPLDRVFASALPKCSSITVLGLEGRREVLKVGLLPPSALMDASRPTQFIGTPAFRARLASDAGLCRLRGLIVSMHFVGCYPTTNLLAWVRRCKMLNLHLPMKLTSGSPATHHVLSRPFLPSPSDLMCPM